MNASNLSHLAHDRYEMTTISKGNLALIISTLLEVGVDNRPMTSQQVGWLIATVRSAYGNEQAGWLQDLIVNKGEPNSPPSVGLCFWEIITGACPG
jgi:hypothetical protein